MVKNILYVCPSSGIGGAETFLISTAKHHNREKFSPHYLLFRDGPLKASLERHNAPVYVLQKPPRLSRPLSHSQCSGEMTRVIEERRISLVHSTMAYGALFSWRVCKQKSILHCWFQHGPASGWMDRWAGRLYHQLLLTNSQYTTQTQMDLESSLFFPKTKKRILKQIPLGTDPMEFTFEARKQLKKNLLDAHRLPENTLTVAMLCRIQPWKGVHLFLAALRELKNSSFPVAGFVWGDPFGDSEYCEGLKQKAQQENIPVHFMGNTDTPHLALQTSDVLVNASTQPEPFGLSIIEAMANGTAVVVPKAGGPKDIIEEGLSGLFFEPNNFKDLAQALQKLTDDSTLLQLQQGAHQRFSSHFLADRMVGDLEAAYDQCAKQYGISHA